MRGLYELLLKLDVDPYEALDLEKYVEDGGMLELHRFSSEQIGILTSLRPDYTLTFHINYVQIRKVVKM